MPQKSISKGSLLEMQERDQAGNIVATYITSSGPEGEARIDIVIPRASHGYTKALLNAFLPAGYPASVTEDYLEYQIYDSLQAFSSSIAGLLSSRAVLEGVGVGDANASPTAALLLSVLQDSMGRIATILFAHRLGTSLEPECKMYRLAADIFNDSAMILDCLSPAFPKGWRVLLLSFSSVLRALCGVAAGSSKASLSAHFATQGNLGELNAKDSSQETVISLLGMLAGSFVVSYIATPFATWTSLLSLLTIHLSMNYLAVRAVSMRSLNRQRANIVFSTYLSTPQRPKILTPREVSPRERIFESDGALRWHDDTILGYCSLGVPFSTILASVASATPSTVTGSYKFSSKSTTVDKILDIFAMQGYVLFYSYDRRRFFIVLKNESSMETQLKGWMHALVAAKRMQVREKTTDKVGGMLRLLEETMKEVDGMWPALVTGLAERGWDFECGAMETKSGTRMEIVDIYT